MTSPKTIKTVYVIGRDVDTDALIQREKGNKCAVSASSENISNFVTDIQVGIYASDERKKRSYAVLVNSMYVNNINLSDGFAG